MRRSLRWALLATVGLTAVALWLPGPSAVQSSGAATVVSGTSAPEHEDSERRRAPSPPTTARAAQRVSLDKPRADPFTAVAVAVPAPKKEPAPVQAVTPPPVAAVPVNTPPALTYRYLGQMTDPAGNQLVYLSKPGRDLRVTVGATLDEGYVVEAIAEDGVRLHHPATDTRAVVAIPRAVAGAAP
jgi:hypothetical protein